MKTNTNSLKSYIPWICTIFFLCNMLILQAQEKYYRVVFDTDKEQLKSLQVKGLEVDHFHYENGKVTAEISQRDLNLLRKNNVKYKIKIRNLSKRIPRINKRIDRRNARKARKNNIQQVPSPSNFTLGSIRGFHTNDEAIAALDKMRQLYPQLITAKSSIGTTTQGRPIYMVKISDNADTDENEDEMLYTSIHHAREPIGLSQNLFFMWYLLENYNSDSEIKTLVDNTELYFIPVVNPDGYIHNQQTNPNGGGLWRKNRRNNGGSYGVDLNRNYGYQWAAPGGSSSNPNSDQYHGPSKFSEPETQAMRDFTNKHNFVAALNYHSYGNLLIHPWGYKANTFTPDQSTFVKICTYMTAENSYTYGTANQTVSYNAGGSSDDWMYGEQSSKPKVFAMTPEVGASNDGFWPASSRIIPLCNEVYPFNIKILRMATKYAKVTPDNVNQTITSTSGTVAYSIKRFSLNQATWKVSLSSNSSHISTLGQPKQYNSIAILGTDTGAIDFQLKSTTPKGTQIPITVTINNGTWEYTTNVTITYNGGSTTCTATVPTGVSSSAIGSDTATINWTAVAGATYDVRYRQTGASSWTTVAASGTSNAITGLSATTAYEAQVRSKCADGTTSDYSTSVNFTTTDVQLNYCASNGKKTNDEYIGKVQVGTINKTSTAGSGGYSDFTAESTNLSKGGANTITITPTWPGTTYDEGYSVWIDYNQDGDFADTGEQVWTKAASKTTPVSGSFTVPATAKDGNTRMRVSMKYNGTPNPCESFDYGEVEDYTVVIGGSGGTDTQAPSAPAGLTASNVAQTTLTLSWNAATDNVGVTGYDVYQGTTNLGSVTATTRNITGLTANTAYQFTVKAKDAAGNVSAASNTLDVTTTGGSSDPCAGVDPYNSSVNYQVGDRVTFQGSLYELTSTGWNNLGACGAFFATTAFSVTATAPPFNEQLKAYPNPAKDFIIIRMNNFNGSTYKIVNEAGEIVRHGNMSANRIELNNLPSGMYFVSVKSETKTITKKLILK
ncbi:putative secreted protein (Por secretion system target) [Aquimarina sp. MAR_2010_214]|uniref:M14 family zinc carboxypeptidase n=1 Tax=Aquimarina sp. MAR_2010_214 TaxID=1250026 RepID=UPI000C6FFACD|nr:M14 family zinc carboxypeptidase [Aquimarina sp. MAR_2010_214]PKV49043.1 putative secreted protein (Por secretion system target) [Aquimarina sp. MAR_2010_214]